MRATYRKMVPQWCLVANLRPSGRAEAELACTPLAAALPLCARTTSTRTIAAVIRLLPSAGCRALPGSASYLAPVTILGDVRASPSASRCCVHMPASSGGR